MGEQSSRSYPTVLLARPGQGGAVGQRGRDVVGVVWVEPGASLFCQALGCWGAGGGVVQSGRAEAEGGGGTGQHVMYGL